jgi:FtsH-binding integral membrane protein
MTGVDAATVGVPRAARDVGLRSHMLKVYNYMSSGVLLTGIVSLLFFNSGYAERIMLGGGILPWIIILSPLAIVFAMSFGANRMATSTLQMLFWAFATLMGLSMSTVFLVYTGTSIAQTFFATAAAFLGLSLYGYTTKRDLSPMGAFLVMGLIGLFIAMIVNMFWQNGMMAFIISVVGVLIFAGLTAWDTQKIKEMYDVNEDGTVTSRKAVMGALTLYLDFINLFLFMLRLLGDRR